MSDQSTLFTADKDRDRASNKDRTVQPDVPDQDDVDYLDLLKQQGRSVDPKELAKAKVHADMFIEQLKAEASEARQELEKRLSYEDLLDQFRKMNTNSKQGEQDLGENSGHVDEGNSNAGSKSISQDEIARLVRETLSSENARSNRERNIETVKNALEEAWGNDYRSKLKKTTDALGASEKFMEDMAATHPKLFLATVGVNQNNAGSQNQLTGTPPRNRQETRLGDASNLNRKNYAYFQKLRKTDPDAYRNSQVEMFRLAKEQGDAFYK